MNHLFEKFHFIYFNWFLKYPVTGDLPAVIVHQPYSFRQIEILTTKPALRVTLGGKWLQEDIPPSPGLNTQMRCLSPMFPQFHFTNESKKSPVPLHSPIICFQGQKKKKKICPLYGKGFITKGNMMGLTVHDFLLFQKLTLLKSFSKPLLSH